MKEKLVSVFSNRDFADHEQVVFCSDDRSGLKAIIAVHNSNLGPVLGGCRMWPYASEDEAVRDVLRLSRGMTYKSAIANLKLGGGKSVIIGNPRTDKTPELLKAFAQAVERLHGRYIAAEDSGTGVDDMKYMAQFTRHVSGVHDKPAEHGTRSGDPSPSTAYGVFVGIQAAVRERQLRASLDGLAVRGQGLGHVRPRSRAAAEGRRRRAVGHRPARRAAPRRRQGTRRDRRCARRHLRSRRRPVVSRRDAMAR